MKYKIIIFFSDISQITETSPPSVPPPPPHNNRNNGNNLDHHSLYSGVP